MAKQAAFRTPDLYTLHGGGLHVSYSTTGIDGKPHFTYQDAQSSMSSPETRSRSPRLPSATS